jgi:hypothetical protein
MTMDPLVANVLLFARVLRHTGVSVSHARVLDAARALGWIDVRRRDDVQTTLRAVMVHRHEDLALFDAAFALFFRELVRRSPSVPPERALDSATEKRNVMSAQLEGPQGDGEVGDHDAGVYSAAAVSRTKDFAEFSDRELDEARRLLANLPWRLGRRRTRRWERAEGATIDLRPILRRTLSDGEMITLAFRRRRTAPRPIVFVGDVSGSMERYSRVLMHFVYGLARHVQHVESFVFSTSLTRITHQVTRLGTDRALAGVVRNVSDWGGGTRIGESLRRFNTRWARRVMRHGPIVIIVSDGWDRGDPLVLARELARVKRSCRRLIWLNPLLGSAHYEPLTRGIQAAMPYIDDFLPAHNLVSLEQLARYLTQ